MVNALAYTFFRVMFPTTLSITESKLLGYTTIGGYPFSNKPKLLLHSISAVSYKTFSLAVDRGRGPLIQSASEGRFCKFYQNIQSVQCRPPTSSHSRALDSHSTRARLALDSIECNNKSRALTQSKTAGTKTYTINSLKLT